jgi:type III secretion protein U
MDSRGGGGGPMSEKTELPTPKRLREAREKGQTPRSRLLSGAAATFAALVAVGGTWAGGAANLVRWTRGLLSAGAPRPAAEVGLEGVLALARLAGPPLAAAAVAAGAVGLVSAGLSFRLALVAPKLERLDPIAGFRRMFGWRPWAEVLKSLAVAAALAWILWDGATAAAPSALRAVLGGGETALAVPLAALLRTLERAAALALVLGAADYALARRRHMKDLMMSREDIRQEHKQSEGDPQHKARRRAAHRQLGQRGPARGVRTATAVVVNPTHVAVALRYAPEECDAPYLVAKGREAEALSLRRQAERLGIPIVRDVPLARTLVHYDVGEEVPEELYRAVAAVLSAAMDLAPERAKGGK